MNAPPPPRMHASLAARDGLALPEGTPPVLIVPGLDDSGPGHWQSLWQAAHPQKAQFADCDVFDRICAR